VRRFRPARGALARIALARIAVAATITVAASCDPATTRPAFLPFPEADTADVAGLVPAATRRLAERLRADSIPLTRVHERDGYMETGWLDAGTLRPFRGRAVGDSAVRLRAWVDPTIPGHSKLTVETAVRPALDPSLPERELERPAPAANPVVVRVRALLDSLAER
jgi:hypothetical protein